MRAMVYTGSALKQAVGDQAEVVMEMMQRLGDGDFSADDKQFCMCAAPVLLGLTNRFGAISDWQDEQWYRWRHGPEAPGKHLSPPQLNESLREVVAHGGGGQQKSA
jgi:hypothetical protein